MPATPRASGPTSDLVLTLIGPDRPGLVESVADTIADHGGNWLESRMAHLAGRFAGILRVEVPTDRTAALAAALAGLEARGLRVTSTAAPDVPLAAAARDAGATGGSPRAMTLDLVGLDRPGLVREVSRLLAQRGINVEELITDRSSAPMSGDMMFRAQARLLVPTTVEVSEVRAGLERLAGDLMVEIKLD